jgi:hypothetical protein
MRGRLGRGVLALALTVCGLARAHAQITVPIEVNHVSQVSSALQVSLPASSSPVMSMQVQIHGLEYANQVSVQVNGQPWISINNTTAQTDPISAMWGGIGGPITNQTLTIPLPAGAVTNGSPATVTFAFNGTDGVSNGFRVLNFNFTRADGSFAVPASTFVLDNPTLWSAPLTSGSSVAAGKQLWNTQPLKASSLPNAPAIKAHCGDCHTADGHDLKYFNYSNPTIIARAMFHGLTQLQGQQIASYIRSLPGPAPGRPWNPPYQPGPGIDSQPASSWAAGAGYQAVLPNDVAMIPYIFPYGINKSAIATKAYLNIRETPIPVPLPTWNQWLPRVHPMDFWGTTFTNDPFYQFYPQLITHMAQQQQAGTLQNYLKGFGNVLGDWEAVLFRNFKVANIDTTANWTPTVSEGVYSTGKWHMVKVWEIMQAYGLENQGNTFFGPGPLTEPLTWCSNAAFVTAPKALGIPEVDGKSVGNYALGQHYYSDAWYQLQLVHNPGNGHLNATNPLDWPYDYGVLDHTAAMTGQAAAVRTLEFMVKAMQETDNGLPPSKLENGWSPQGTDGIYTIEHDQGLWAGVPAATQGALLTALLGAWTDKNLTVPASLYYNAGITSQTDIPNLNADLWGSGARFVDETAFMVNRFYALGADPSVCDAACNWAQTVWPDFNWSQYEH